ncbi:MAG: DUF6064 family protein [Rudaea sp.]
MSEWWTYRISSFLLFSPRTYHRLLELYNTAIWPLQLVALGLGITILVLARDAGARSGRLIAAILAACWLDVAWSFHLRHYATINWAAPYFAAAFATQALLLVWQGAIRGRWSFGPSTGLAQSVGRFVVAFALVGQPLVALVAGRRLVETEIFGVAPDPTAVATLGLLLMLRRPSVAATLVPLAWCALSGALQWAMAARDALVTPLAALLVLSMLLVGRRAG